MMIAEHKFSDMGRNFINLGRNKINANDVITFCLDLMNKMLWYLINLRWNLIKYIQFDVFINDVMFFFYLVAVMVGITGFTGFSYFGKMMS